MHKLIITCFLNHHSSLHCANFSKMTLKINKVIISYKSIRIENINSNPLECRSNVIFFSFVALLNTASYVSLISAYAADILGLKKDNVDSVITELNDSACKIKNSCRNYK